MTPSRRDFLTTTSAAALAAQAVWTPHVSAASGTTIRVGLVGCGGRGTGAAAQAAGAGPDVKITALCDMFEDRLQKCHKRLGDELGDKYAVKADRLYHGFDGYKQLIDSGDVDVVLLCTPPHFRPAQLEYAIEKNKHVFAEKPCAVDAPGVRRVLAACEVAKQKNLSVVSGLCWRYDNAKRESMKRVQGGEIGEIVNLQCSYNTRFLWHMKRKPEWSDMEFQLRNWLYYTWLSGDFNVEQHIHSLDKMAWAMNNVYPVRCSGMGGQQVRTDPQFGNIFDHHSVVYEWENGVKLFACCRQIDGCAVDVSDHIFGTKGTAAIMEDSITPRGGGEKWKYKGPGGSMYQLEHDELFAAVRNNKPVNNGEWMAKSTMLAIMGRMATYTGKVITWEMAMNSKQDLSPAKYEFGPLAMPPVAVPGVTKFV